MGTTDPVGGGETNAPLWRQRRYLTWLIADTGSGLGATLHAFVLPLVVILMTGNAALAGLVAALGMVAQMLTMLAGGVLADRHDLRHLMVICGAAGAVLLALMAASYAQDLGVGALALLNVASGTRSGLLGVSSNAALKQVVSAQQLPVASSANQARDAAVQLGGAPLGGALLILGPVVALLTAAGFFLASMLAALGLRGDFRPDRDEVTTSSAWREALDGMRWLWSQQVLRRILLASALINLGLTLALSTLVYGYGLQGMAPARIGLVSSVVGAGMLVGAAAATRIVQVFPTGIVASVGTALAGLGVAVLPWVQGFWPVLAVLFISMLGAPAVNAAMLSYFMHLVPRRLLGRSMSAASLVNGGAAPLAPVLAGFMLSLAGMQVALLTAAGICLSAVAVLVTDRRLRSLPRPELWTASSE